MSTSLISIASVKDWLNTSGGQPYPPEDVPMLTRLIGSVSQFATSYLSRSFVPATYSEVYNGNGGKQLPLRQTPVIAVTSLTIGVVPIAARTAVGQFGFVSDADSVYLDGGGWYGAPTYFWRGMQNVAVTYTAGFQQADTMTVPSGTPFVIDTTSLSRPWNSDRGVAYASGAAFTLVMVPPTVAGTYQLWTDSFGNAEYVFAAADIGASVVITYGYTPEDVQQALIELVGERFKVRSRIGIASTSIGGVMTNSFSQKDMNATIKALLQPYKRVAPIQ